MSQLQPRQGIPLRADPAALRDTAVASLTRAAIAIGIGAIDRQRPADVVRQRGWAEDRGADLVLRAAVAPTTIAGSPAFMTTVAVAFLATLVPMSAGADLLQRGISLSFDGAASISVPRISLPAASFVGESKPIPVVAGTSSPGPVLQPKKLAVITTLTRETMASSNAETLVRQALVESVGPALDAVLFSANAATVDAPAGLLNGIVALTPAAAGPSKGELIVNDLQALAGAVASVAGNGGVCLIASPDAAVALILRLPAVVAWPILVSAGLAPRTIIAIAANAIASAVDGPPSIDASTEASLHRDSVPGELVDVGGVMARPIGSLFQSDQVALRLRWPISWVLRSSAGVAFMQGVNW